jgi:hypothetical protein
MPRPARAILPDHRTEVARRSWTGIFHLKKVFADHELQEDSVIQYFRITAAAGKPYDTQH